MSDPSTDLLDGAAVIDALRELRPEAAAFREGLARRVSELEAEERARAEQALRSPFLRSAAALLPASWLPGSLASKLSGLALTPRALLALVLYPAFAFLWLVYPFLLAFSWMGGEGGKGRRQQEELLAWWRARKRSALFTLLVLFAVFLVEPAGGAAALMLASTAALLLLLSHLRAAGFDTRRDVGRRCAFFLTMLTVCFGGLSRYSTGSPPHLLDAAWAALALGAVVTSFLAIAAVHRTVWSFLTRSDGVEAGLAIIGLALLAILVAVVAVPLLVGTSYSEVMGAGVRRLAGLDAAQERWRLPHLLFAASCALLSLAAVIATWRAPRGELAAHQSRSSRQP